MNLNLLETHTTKKSAHKEMNRAEIIKRIIEALFFASNEPLSLQKLKDIICTEVVIQKDELKKIINNLKEEYLTEKRGYQLDEIAEGYLLRTCEDMHPFVSLLQAPKKKDKLGPAAMEVVAIIAYRAPITKAEIEQIRGVDCSGPLQTLQERALIEVVGNKETLGRPRQFGVTKRFLKHFGLKSIEQLAP